jgi:hypothetical protein
MRVTCARLTLLCKAKCLEVEYCDEHRHLDCMAPLGDSLIFTQCESALAVRRSQPVRSLRHRRGRRRATRRAMRESPGAKQRRRQPPLGEAVAHSQKRGADDCNGDSLPDTLTHAEPTWTFQPLIQSQSMKSTSPKAVMKVKSRLAFGRT